MKKSIFGALVCAMLMVVVGCCACRSAQKNAKPLKTTEWHLIQLGGQEMDLPLNVFNITIAEDNSLAGVGACNRLLGQVVLGEKQAISFGQVGTTMMLCPENGDLERVYLNILSKTTHYDIDYNLLMLMENGTILAVFEAQPEK